MSSDRLSPAGLALAIFTACCSALGIAAMKLGLSATPLDVVPFAAGFVVYVIGLATGVVLVGAYPVSLAYPIVIGLSLVMLSFLAALWLGEPLTPGRLGGTVLVILGVALLAGPTRTSRRRTDPPPLQ